MCFITPWGKFRYLHGPMGLAPMGDWFNFATDLVINGIEGLEKSVDDVLATCESAEEPRENFGHVSCKVQRTWGHSQQKEVQVFNNDKIWQHVLDTHGEDLVVRSDPDQLERLRSFPVPKTLADVQSLTGMINTFDR